MPAGLRGKADTATMTAGTEAAPRRSRQAARNVGTSNGPSATTAATSVARACSMYDENKPARLEVATSCAFGVYSICPAVKLLLTPPPLTYSTSFNQRRNGFLFLMLLCRHSPVSS